MHGDPLAHSPEDEPMIPQRTAPSPISFPLATEKRVDPPTPKAAHSLPKIGETPVWNDPGNTPTGALRPMTIHEKDN